MEHLSARFPTLLEQMDWARPDSTALEQLTVYFLSRWWLKASCDGYIWRQAAAAVVSVLAVAALAAATGDIQSAARLYSKAQRRKHGPAAKGHGRAAILPQRSAEAAGAVKRKIEFGRVLHAI